MKYLKLNQIVLVGWLLLTMSILTYSQAKGEEKAFSDTNREIVRTFVNFHLQQDEFEKAQKVLIDHLDNDRKDSEAWNLLGKTYLRLNNYSQAAHAFYQAVKTAKKETNRGVYLYRYADTFAQAGKTDGAKKILRHAAEVEELKSSVRDALSTLKPGVALPELQLVDRSGWGGSLSLGGGYDTNALLLSESQLETLSQSQTASPLLTPSARLRYSSDLSPGRIQGFIQSQYRHYFNDDTSQFNSLGNAIGLRWDSRVDDHPGFSQALKDQFSYNLLNTDGLSFFNWQEAIHWKAKMQHTYLSESGFDMQLRYQKYATAQSGNPEDNRSGFGLAPSLYHQSYFGKNLTRFELTYDQQFAKGDNFKTQKLAFKGSVSRRLFAGILGSLGVQVSRILYPESQTNRQDTPIQGSVVLNRRWSRHWTTALTYQYRRNLSNLSTADYSKHNAVLNLSYHWGGSVR